MKAALPLLLALAVTGCSASPARPASSGEVSPAPSPPRSSAAPQGVSAPGVTTASTGSVKAEPAPAEPSAPRAFPAVTDPGLVTFQSLALVGPEDSTTIRVGTDGSWTRSGASPSSGTLDAKQLSALRALMEEVGKAKPSTEPSIPCDAITSVAARVVFGKGREIGWSGPCAGPPPPVAVQVLAIYLRQVADGRPASELEQTLARPR